MINEIEYRENKIKELLWSMSSDYSELSFMWEYTPDETKSEPEYLFKEADIQDNFEEKAKSVYQMIIAYLESVNHIEYLKDFKAEFSKLLNDRKELFSGEINNDIAELISKTVGKFWKFLAPFEFSQRSHIEKLLKQTGVIYLERILRNTQVILNETKTNPTTEPQVYNAVKFVVQSVFPSALAPNSGFFKSFKNYHPDILIPEIHTAIEYKYADSLAKLKTQVDEVAADTKGYTGDTNYEIFYAVFYVTDDFWGIDKFQNVWEEMEFPKNWKGIYIVGKK